MVPFESRDQFGEGPVGQGAEEAVARVQALEPLGKVELLLILGKYGRPEEVGR